MDKVDSCISILYLAENNSRLYILTRDISYFNSYQSELEIVITRDLGRILQNNGEHQAIEELLDRKLAISKRLLKLSIYAGSLLELAVNVRIRLHEVFQFLNIHSLRLNLS